MLELIISSTSSSSLKARQQPHSLNNKAKSPVTLTAALANFYLADRRQLEVTKQQNCNCEASVSTAAGWRLFSTNVVSLQENSHRHHHQVSRQGNNRTHWTIKQSHWSHSQQLLRTSIWLTDDRRQLEVTKQRTNGVLLLLVGASDKQTIPKFPMIRIEYF